MFRRTKLLFTLIFAIGFLVACTTEAPTSQKVPVSTDSVNTPEASPSTDKGSGGGKGGPLKIGVSINATSNIHNQKMFKYAEEAIKASGHEAIMVNGNGVAVKQATDIENLIQSNVDVIIIQNGDPDSLGSMVQEAVNKGIKVISMESGFMPGISTLIAQNDYEIASAIYMILSSEIGFEGDVISVGHNENPALRIRGSVQEAFFKEYKAIKKVSTVTSTFPGTVEVTYKGVESALQANPNVKAIFASQDLEAIGATQALKAAGRTDIITVGVDGELEALESIRDGGPIIATVVGDLVGAAELLVRLSEKIVAGESIEKYYPTPYDIVTIDNVDKFLEE